MCLIIHGDECLGTNLVRPFRAYIRAWSHKCNSKPRNQSAIQSGPYSSTFVDSDDVDVAVILSAYPLCNRSFAQGNVYQLSPFIYSLKTIRSVLPHQQDYNCCKSILPNTQQSDIFKYQVFDTIDFSIAQKIIFYSVRVKGTGHFHGGSTCLHIHGIS